MRSRTGNAAGIETDIGSGKRDSSEVSVGFTRPAVRDSALAFKPTACSKVMVRSASMPTGRERVAVSVLPEIWGVRTVCAAAGSEAQRTNTGTYAVILLTLPP